MGKLSFDISMNTQGYVSSAKQAENANKDLEKSTKEYLESFGPLTKQLRTAKTEARNLAVQFSQLSKAEKESEIGQQLAADLDFAIKKSAELKDIMADVDSAISKAASDTAGIDGLIEAFGIGKSAAMGFAGAIAKVSGESESLNGLMSTLAITEGAFGTVTKLTTALQKDSKMMMALQEAGVISLTQAEKINTGVTQASTIATKALGMAMKALPYVAIAAAIAGVIAVLVKLNGKTSAQLKAEKELQEELKKSKKAWEDSKKTVADSVSSQLAEYEMLRQSWLKLKTAEEQNKFLDDNKSKFENMGFAINDVNELEDFFVKNTAAVVKALKARAEAEAWGEIYKEKYKEKINKDVNGSVDNGRYYKKAKEGDEISDDEAKALGIKTRDLQQVDAGEKILTVSIKHRLTAEEAATVNAYRNAEGLKKQAKEQKELNKYLEGYNNALEESAKAQAELPKNLTTGKGDKGGGSNTKEQLTYLQQLIDTAEKAKKKIEDLGKNATTEQINAAWKDYRKALKDVEDYKILIGIEVKDPVTELEKNLKDAVTQAANDYKLAVINNDEAARQAAQEAYYVAQKALNDYNLSIKIEPQVDIAKVEEQKQKIQDVVNQAMTPSVKEKSFDFSLLPEGIQDEANLLLDQYKRIEDAKKQLNKVMQESNSDAEIAAAQKGLDELGVKYDELGEKLQTFDTKNKTLEDQQKKWEDVSEAISLAGDAMNAIGDLFSAIAGSGEDEDPNAKAMSIIFQTLATMTLSFANALKSCSTWVEWLVFGVTGMAQLIAMTKQIKQITSEKHAGGGIIGGNSFFGDRILASLNSGEMVMNGNQQQRLWNILNGTNQAVTPGNNSVKVEGVISGKNLLLVQRNTNKIGSKSGQSININ